MSTIFQPRFTPAEYLSRERASDQRSELIKGQIYAMAGASRRHSLIVGNIFGEIRNGTRGRPCEAHPGDLRVKVQRTEMYTYPDIAAMCGTPELEDDHGDTLLNPTVIVEVLSPSTESYDRGQTFAHYRRLDSLREYILVAQDTVSVEQYVRNGETWTYVAITDPDAVLRIDALGCEIPLRTIYEGVAFGEELNAR
jgi:Uma2 family endonuclease